MFWRLIGTYGVLTVVAIAALGLVLQRRVERHEQRLVEAALRAEGRLLDRNLRGLEGPALQQRIDELARQSPGQRITLIGAGGEVVADTARDAAAMEAHGARPEVAQARVEGVGRDLRRSDTTGSEQLYVAVRRDTDEEGVAVIRLSQSLEAEPLADLGPLVLTTAAAAAGVALALTVWFARRIARPIQQVTQAAEHIAAGSYGEKVYAPGRGEVARLAATFNRMSQRLAEQIKQLEEDQAQLRAILGGMVEGVVALDAEQRILFINDRARLLLGIGGGAVGRKLWDVVRQRTLLDMVKRAVSSPEPQSQELTWDGPPRRSLTVHAARLPGEPSRGAVLVLHDTSELRRLERVRREFVANVSHELKTPLTVIQACVETLLEGGAAEHPEPRRSFLEQVNGQARRLHALILDLLSLARIESGAEVFTLQSVSLHEAMTEVCQRHQARAEGRGQTLTTVAGEDVPIWADEEAVLQILENLIDNALKYTPEGGRIQVRCWAEAGVGCVEVQDDGIGIPPQDLPRIFERFYRVDKARSREMGGTGLGLSIVKHLVHAMQGSISATSRVGAGTTFTVRLPQQPPSTA